jgi:D-arabinose 1-dehydrogenase-like Zn-dependent alcohol dehydrogenase
MNTFSGTLSPPISLHPALTRALTPVLSTASNIVAVSLAGSSTTIEPKLLMSRGREISGELIGGRRDTHPI